MQQGHWCLKLSLIFIILALLSACQPPVSGESAGIQTPYLYWKLQQTELAATPLQIPVKGVNIGQIQDTWGAARSEGRKHQGTDIFAARGTDVIAATDGKKAYNHMTNTYRSVGMVGDHASHSLRYAWSQEQEAAYLAQGMSPRYAYKELSQDLGHGDGRGRYVAMVYCRKNG